PTGIPHTSRRSGTTWHRLATAGRSRSAPARTAGGFRVRTRVRARGHRPAGPPARDRAVIRDLVDRNPDHLDSDPEGVELVPPAAAEVVVGEVALLVVEPDPQLLAVLHQLDF